MRSDNNKTTEEHMAMARVLGQHLAADIYPGDPMIRMANLAIHFLTSKPRCPLCLDGISKAKDKSNELR